MDRQFAVAVVGATGLVGEMMINVLDERAFPVSQLFPLASNRSLGRSVSFRGQSYPVSELEGFDFAQCDFALFSAGAAVSREHAPRAAAAGCIVIDNTSEFRYRESVPLVVPEVNPQALEGFGTSGIVANPNCSTIQLVVALKPLHDEAHLERIEVATYQSVSGAGREAVEELARQSIAALSGQGLAPTHGGVKPIAFNCVPHIDVFQENGYTREEMKIVWETRKILGEPQLRVNATAVRVPVFYGHSEAVHLELREKASANDVRALLEKAPGVKVIDERKAGGYPTPVSDAAGKDETFVGRIREDVSHPNGIDLWIVSDNIRKGAALNAVQVGELLIKDYL